MHLAGVVSLSQTIHGPGWVLNAYATAFSIVICLILIQLSPEIIAIPHKLADRRFRELIENAPDAIVQVDAKGTIVIANHTAETIFGYSREELLGSNVDFLIPMDRRPAHEKHRESFMDAGVARPMGRGMVTLHALRKDGTEVPVEIDLSPVKQKGGGYVTAIIRDITERKRIEGELQRAHEMLKSVLGNTNVAIYAVDRDWVFRYLNSDANKGLEKLRDLSDSGPLLGKILWACFPGISQVTAERFRGVMRTRTPDNFDSYYEPTDLWTHMSVHPWDEGGITVFYNDISEQKRLERELEKERALNGQRTEVLARLSSGLAHEIKNPLAIIHARASDLSDMAEDGDVDRAQIAKACASIVQTSDRAIRILHGIAAMARVGTHDPMENADVRKMVEQAVQLVEGRYKVNSIRLDTVFPAGLPLLKCREVQISQILLNLLNNAFDAVDTDAKSERWIRIVVSLRPGEEFDNDIERIQISVMDGGPGVAPEHRERLMHAFFTTKSLGAVVTCIVSASHTVEGSRHAKQESLALEASYNYLRLEPNSGTRTHPQRLARRANRLASTIFRRARSCAISHRIWAGSGLISRGRDQLKGRFWRATRIRQRRGREGF